MCRRNQNHTDTRRRTGLFKRESPGHIILETPSPRGDSARDTIIEPREGGTREARRARSTTCAHGWSAKRCSTRAESAGDRPGLWGEGAPIRVVLRADSHCTCCGSTRAFPRTLAHDDLWTTPPHTLALGRSAKRALHRAFRAARSVRRLRHPHQEATRAVIGGDNMHM